PHLHQRLAASYAVSRAMPSAYVRDVTAHIHARASHHGLPRWEDYIREASCRTPGSENPRLRDR
ncbi:hypothetical protein, partial [Streptomyces sp. UNOC14_S4]|uniref:hypothetical protein n=1 Tax=Streptomyces sp. UNOC14_S4 TaxID=2872340 RepID=UPI001E3008E3